MGCAASNHSEVIKFSEDSDMVADAGGSAAQNPELKDLIRKGRDEIRDAQEKLNSSLKTPLVDSEQKVIESGSWLQEIKDVQKKYDILPPIHSGKKIKDNGAMAFTID